MILVDEKQQSKTRVRSYLVSQLRKTDRIVNYLYKQECIDRDTQEAFQDVKTLHKKAEYLVDLVYSTEDEELLKKFMTALDETDQHHLTLVALKDSGTDDKNF